MSRGATAGLILAAGAGTRFGPSPKLLAELDGRPLVEHAIRTMCAVTELDPVAVVLGAHAEQVRAEVDFGRAQAVVCPAWEQGLSSSLRCGVAALPDPDQVLVVLGDAPRLTVEVVRRLLAAAPGTRASYGGVPGHPVLLGPEQLRGLEHLKGDVGARELLSGAQVLECGELTAGVDVDTAADLARLRRPG